MANIFIVKQQLPARQFQGNNGMVTVVELLLSDGTDSFVATLNERDTTTVLQQPLTPGTTISAILSFNAVKGQSGYFQNVRILKFGIYV